MNVLRSTAADARTREVDPMYFDLVNVNQGNLYNRSNGTVTVGTSGYYYIYISAGARQQTVSLLLVGTIEMCDKVFNFENFVSFVNFCEKNSGFLRISKPLLRLQ